MSKYGSLMKEVKLRVDVICSFRAGRSHALYEPPTIECVCLQIRKILELIAFGSLVANKPLFVSTYKHFATTWNAELLFRDLERINPNFYPRAIREVASTAPGVKSDFEDRTDALTREEFVDLYKKCGALMHARNPYGSPVDLGVYKNGIPLWTAKIMALLNCHTIRLVTDEKFYLVHMKEDGDEEVHWYEFVQTSLPVA